MKLFVPLIFYEVSEEDKEVCDGVLQCFYDLKDMRILYPDVDYLEVDVSKPNIHDN